MEGIVTSCMKASNRSRSWPFVPLPLLPKNKPFHTADAYSASIITKRDPTVHNHVGLRRAGRVCMQDCRRGDNIGIISFLPVRHGLPSPRVSRMPL